MNNSDWRAMTEALIVGAIIYAVMRFLVPHSIDYDTRSLIGAGIGFVVTLLIGWVRKAHRSAP